MKILSALIMFVALGVVVYGQNRPAGVGGHVTTFERTQKGVPFSAEAINESVQVLADGNRITRTWSYKIYRNSEGRTRRESSGQGAAFGGTFIAEPSVTIMDPGAGFRFHIDPDSKTAKTFVMAAPEVKVDGQAVVVGGIDDKIKAEIEAARSGAIVARQSAEAVRAIAVERLAAETLSAAAVRTHIAPVAISSKYETRTEQLGVQNIEGVDAEGTRTVTTIPADAIGNERPIEIVYERWYSKELQQVLYSKRTDPRFGEQTYRLTNINRSEPDPALFSVPNGYRVQGTPGTMVYSEGGKAAIEQVYQVRPTPATPTATRTKKPNN